jgi:hypothetical protein
MSAHEKELFFKSMEKWGYASQILMLAEESSELSVACLHSLRAKKEKARNSELAEEIADVEFMIAEIKYCLDLGPDVQLFREEKMKRLEEYLKE